MPGAEPTGDLAVIRPVQDEEVYGCLTVRGTGTIPPERELWVTHRTLVRNDEVGQFHTFRRAEQSVDGTTWRTKEFNIGDGDTPQFFAIYVFTVPHDLATFLTEIESRNEKSHKEGGNPALTALPPIDLVTRREVSRPVGDCRR